MRPLTPREVEDAVLGMCIQTVLFLVLGLAFTRWALIAGAVAGVACGALSRVTRR